MNNQFKNLFSPIKIGGQLFRNRIINAPTGVYNCIPLGMPSEAYIEYFQRKAKGGAAAVNIGECYVDDIGVPRSSGFIMTDDPETSRRSMSRLADGISRYGAIGSVELNKRGIVGAPDENGIIWGPSEHNLFSRGEYSYPDENGDVRSRAMSEEQILEAIESFVKGAEFSKNCGFGMVTIHAGHGWFLHQFLSPTINRRTDRWGGTHENRARIVVMICDEIHKRCGAGFPVEVRMSGAEAAWEGGYEIDEGIAIAKQLDGHADLIHVSVGNIFIPESMGATHPGIFAEEACNVKYAAAIKPHVKTPVATVGALCDPAVLEDIIASGKADVVALARGLIVDPDMPLKVREGREKEQIRCLRCFSCVGSMQFTGQLFCVLNPESGREWEQNDARPPAKKQKVLVAGGGVAGIQAAITATEQGHDVILCEKSDKLGGVVLWEKDIPYKSRLFEYLDRQQYMLSKLNVDVRLNTEVTPEYAAEISPDVIVIAVGSRELTPPIPGVNTIGVISAEKAFQDPSFVGDSVVILGCGLTGAELGLQLHTLGKSVEIIERNSDITAENNRSFGYSLKGKLSEAGVPIRFDTTAIEITESGVKCSTPDGEVFLNADTVILSTGREPLTDKVIELSSCAPRFYQIGDCRSLRTVGAATAEAWTAGLHIGRYG